MTDGGMKAGDKIDVIITGEERVRYRRAWSMPKEDYARYEKMCRQYQKGKIKGSDIDEEFNGYFDSNNLYDGDGIEDVTITLAKAHPL